MTKYVYCLLTLICVGHVLLLFPFFTYLIVTGNLLVSQEAGMGFTSASACIVIVSTIATFISWIEGDD